jgi:thioredoxin-like negative regulator of GroEL
MTATLCATVVQIGILLVGADASSADAAKKTEAAKPAEAAKPTEAAKTDKAAKLDKTAKSGKAAKPDKAAKTTEEETYTEAHRATVASGKPMVVMVGADWCPPCQTMKRTILPKVRERGLLRKVAFAIVNFDRERELARKITGGGPIPQLIMFRRTANGWASKKLIGSQSVETVEQFIEGGLASTRSGKKADDEDDTTAPPDVPKVEHDTKAADANSEPT